MLKQTFAFSGNASTFHGKIIQTAMFRDVLRLVKNTDPLIFSSNIFYGEDTLLIGAIYAHPAAVYSPLLTDPEYCGYYYNVRRNRGIRGSLDDLV